MGESLDFKLFFIIGVLIGSKCLAGQKCFTDEWTMRMLWFPGRKMDEPEPELPKSPVKMKESSLAHYSQENQSPNECT